MMAEQMKKPVSPHTAVRVDKEAADAYLAQYRNEEELRKEGAIDFAKWLAKEWMSIWVVDRWLWEWQPERTPETIHMHLQYYTEEELYELYLKECNEN